MMINKIAFAAFFSILFNACSGDNNERVISTFYSVLSLHKQNKPEEIEKLITIANGIDATGIFSDNEYFNQGVQVLNSYGIPDSSSFYVSEKDGYISVAAFIKLNDSIETNFVFNAVFINKRGEHLLSSYYAYYSPNPLLAGINDNRVSSSIEDSSSEFARPFSLNVTWTDSVDSPQGFILIMDNQEIINFIEKYNLRSIIRTKNIPSDSVDFEIHDFYLPQYGNRTINIVYNYYLFDNAELQTTELRFFEHGVKSKPVPLLCISNGMNYRYTVLERESDLYKSYIQFINALIANER